MIQIFIIFQRTKRFEEVEASNIDFLHFIDAISLNGIKQFNKTGNQQLPIVGLMDLKHSVMTTTETTFQIMMVTKSRFNMIWLTDLG